MVPKGWEKNSLDSLFEFKNGLNTEKEQYGNGYKFVNVMDVFRNDILTESKIIGRVQVTDKQLEGYQLKYGDVLFNRTSETFDEIAIAAIYLDNAIATFGGFVIRARPKGNQIDPAYSVFLFQSKSYRSQVVKLGQGAIRANIGQKDLARVCILVPPLAEQKKIAQILSTWDKAISVTEKLLANSQQQKKALMQQLLTGKKRLLDENGVRFSGDWGKFTLSHFGKCIRGVSYKPENICENESDNTIRLLRSTNIQNGELNDKDLIILPKKLVKPMQVLMDGDLAICMANGSKSLVGKSAPYKPNDADYTVGAFCALFRPLKSVSSSFVKFLFESNQYQSQLLVILAGSSINNLKGSDIESINIDAPLHYKEQQKIASVLSAADTEISTLEKKLACLKDEKKALMQQLLTGKRRVKVDEAVAV
ncbi:restriction endonuclease subunit S [Escherichia coli]|uniref:Restriction endonuclease subunit S n=5 Tax=Escherichia coli TaxID=562 RepID=A0A8S7XGX7_ECOLX|nr:restriction endonuclease subunit S [Escherichia coli]EHX8402374.1 restriction endonuclease subunit S [Shigella sonnei]EER1590355.1 restriction endonuclease subunit S [Escherichia coli]EEV7775695.1 restriction endonuclease subunit S [Escherichia coli]EEY5912531.1 restriction endonuclease subunit S [Escherichia coli]EEZ9505918.1 restriction endonuclease subunit S [Escherichia coli]